jgi:hypothetical protein
MARPLPKTDAYRGRILVSVTLHAGAGRARVRKELQTPEEFESMLGEEIEVSSEFGLPLCILAVRLPGVTDGDPESEELRRMLDAFRIVDLTTTAASRGGLTAALPNTSPESTALVAERLREVEPGAEIREAAYTPGDTSKTLVERVWRTLEG